MKRGQVNMAKSIAAAILLLFTVYAASVAEAASPYGRFGWTDPITSIDGDDTTCADPGEVLLTLELRDRNTNATTTVDSAIVAIYDKTGPTKVYVTHAEGSGPRIGPVCYNPDTDSVAYDVDGGASYRNFYASYVDETPGLMPRQKAVTGIVWVTPASVSTYEYQQVSPSPTVVQVTNVSPSYTYQVNYMHNAYGANALSMVNFFVVNFDPLIPNYTTVAVSKVVNQSGGTGSKTIPAEALADGWYGWSLYLHLNKNHVIEGSYEALDVPKSGFLNLWAPFVLDRTSPAFTSLTHTPVSPASTSTITISSNATDALSGVTKLEIYVDGVLSNTCNFAAVASAACSTTVGPFAAGSTHPYYVIATDYAGNVSTSATNNIVVSVPLKPDLISKDLSVSAGPYVQNTAITISAAVENTGTANTTTGFNDKFSYQWGSAAGAWLDFSGNTVARGALSVGATANDGPVNFTPATSGNLYIQHCVDVSTQVDEGVSGGEDNNCTVLGPLTVNPPAAPALTLSANPTTVTLGTSTILTWTVTGTADTCTATGDWSGSKAATAGTHTESITPATTGSKTYSLECWNSGVSSGIEAASVTVTAPNLTSTFSLTGSYTQGTPIPLSASVTNSGSVATLSGFSDNFSYRWSTMSPWTDIAPFSAHGILGAGATENDSSSYTPTQSGTLYVQHCVDSYNDINEGVNEMPNCVATSVSVDSPACLGVFANASLCVGDDTGLSGSLSSTLVGSCTATKCEYICDVGYQLVTGSSCVKPDIYSENALPASATAFLNTDNITFTGRAVNTATAPITQGGWADLEIDWNSDGGPQADGGTGFDDNYNAFGGSQLGSFTQSQSKDLSYTISAGSAPVGTHRYRFNVDTDNTGVINEDDEVNNRSAWVTFVVNPPATPTLTLSANPTTVTLGTSTILTWTVTGTADTCTATGDWSGSKTATAGTHTESVTPATTGSKTYSLECWNSGVSSGIETASVTVAAPNLTSTFSLIGSYTQGTPIPLSASVTNSGSVATLSGFSDNFSYRWSTMSPWTDITPFSAHGILGAGATENDSSSYTPTQSGTLYVQHCVDSYNDINEGVNEMPNCVETSVGVGVPSCPPGEIWDGNSCEPIDPSPLTCTDNTTIIVDSSQAWNGSWAGTPQSVKKIGSLVYAGASGDDDTNGLYIFDVSDPTNITQRSFFSTYAPISVQNNSWGNDVLGLDVVGDYAYLATNYGGLVIVNVADVDAPTFAGKVALYGLNPPGAKETWDVEVSGNHAFLASGKGLIVVDIGNKASPVVVANLVLGTAVSQDIILSGNYAYVAMRDEGFFIVDISNPSNPVQVAHVSAGYGAGAWAYALEKKGEILYVGNHYSELVDMYNVADPTMPIYVDSVPVPITEDNGTPRELYVEGDALYVSAGRGGLYVFDITTPALPVQLIRIPKPPFPGTAKVWAIAPLDAADPSELVVISEDMLAGVYTTMTLCERRQDLYSENVTPASGTDFLSTDNITFTGRAVNTATAPITQGGWADLEIDWNSDGGSQADGGTGFDDNYNAFGGSQLGSFTQSQSKDLSYTISAGSAPVGTHRYRFNVDTDNTGVINEDDEVNNRSAWVTFTVSDAMCLAGEVMNWTVGTESCTGAIGTSRYPGESENVVDSIEDPAVGVAAFSCRANATWDPVPTAATCAVPALPDTPIGVTVRVDRELIRVGTTATVTVEVNVRVPATCTVYGASDVPFTFTHSGIPANQSYAYSTRVLTTAQVVTVRCSPDVATPGVGAGNGEARIEVVPDLQEV